MSPEKNGKKKSLEGPFLSASILPQEARGKTRFLESTCPSVLRGEKGHERSVFSRLILQDPPRGERKTRFLESSCLPALLKGQVPCLGSHSPSKRRGEDKVLREPSSLRAPKRRKRSAEVPPKRRGKTRFLEIPCLSTLPREGQNLRGPLVLPFLPMRRGTRFLESPCLLSPNEKVLRSPSQEARERQGS